MPLTVNPLSDTDDPKKLISNLRQILNDLEDQLNRFTLIYFREDTKLPKNLQVKSLLIRLVSGIMSVGVITGPGVVRNLTADDLQSLQKQGTNFLGLTESTANPTTAEFPNSLDWGFHYNQTSTILYFVFNYNSTIKKVALT